MAPRASNTEPSAWPAPAAIGFLAAIVLVAAQDCEELRPVTIAPPQPPAVATGETVGADAGAEGEEGEAAPERPPVDEKWLAEYNATMDRLKNPPRRKLARLRTPRVPRKGWPVTCPHDPCVTADDEPGYRCVEQTECFNPCPVGMAPGDVTGNSTMCLRFCNVDADCPDKLCQYGLCVVPEPPDRWNRPREDFACKLPDGRWGYKVEGDERCYPYCKTGQQVWGGDRCAKECTRDSDCPGGACSLDQSAHFCMPVCTSAGCPYPWE